MSSTLRKGCGALCGLIMGLCVIATIKIGADQTIANWVYDALGITGYTPNKYLLIGILFLSWWIWGKTMKEIHAIWINWARICFSLLMFVAMISFLSF